MLLLSIQRNRAALPSLDFVGSVVSATATETPAAAKNSCSRRCRALVTDAFSRLMPNALICWNGYGKIMVVVAGDEALPAVSLAMTSMVFSPDTP